MRVRKAVSNDYEVIRDLVHALDAFHGEHAPAIARVPDEPRFTQADMTEVVANENCLLLVGEHEGSVVGCVEASVQMPERSDEPDAPWCMIHNLAVDARWRRRGLGTLLVRAVEEWARSRGIAQVQLDVFEFNRAAQAFYEGLGYQTLHRHMGKSVAAAVRE